MDEEINLQKQLRKKAEAQVLKLEADLIFIRKDGEEQEQELQKLRRDLGERDSRVACLQSQLEAAESKLEDEQRRAKEAEEASAARELEFAKAANERDAEVTREVQAAAATAVMLQQQIKERDAALAGLQAERAEMLEQLQQDAMAIAELDRDLQAMMGRLGASEERAEVLKGEAEAQEGLRRDVEALLDAAEAEADGLRERLAEAQAREAAATAAAEAERAEAVERSEAARAEAVRASAEAEEAAKLRAAEARAEALKEGAAAVAECMGAVSELEAELRALMAHVEAQASMRQDLTRAALTTGVWELKSIPDEFKQVALQMFRRAQACREMQDGSWELRDRIVALEEEAHLLRMQRDHLMFRQHGAREGSEGSGAPDPPGRGPVYHHWSSRRRHGQL